MVVKHKIVIIDDHPANLQILIQALKHDYIVIPFSKGIEAQQYFVDGNSASLILLDVNMPDTDGFSLLKIFGQIPASKNIPIIFLTGRDDLESEIEGLNLGAVDYITKPVNPQIAKKRIAIHINLDQYKNHLETMVSDKTQMVEKLTTVTILALISLVESRDRTMGGHLSRTQSYVVTLAEKLMESGKYLDHLSYKTLDILGKSAPLHDLGKVGISGHITSANRRLTEAEFEEMKQHTIIGANAIRAAREELNNASFLDMAEVLARYHHERWDGTGYPYRLKGEAIPLFARIMAVADVYDALTSERSYKKAYPHEEAVAIIMADSGKHFDPDICKVFYDNHLLFKAITQNPKDSDILGVMV